MISTLKKSIIITISLFCILFINGCNSKHDNVIKNFKNQYKISDLSEIDNDPLKLFKLGITFQNSELYRDSIIYLQKSYDIRALPDADIKYFPSRELAISYYLLARDEFVLQGQIFDTHQIGNTNLEESNKTTPKSFLRLQKIKKYCQKSIDLFNSFLSGAFKEDVRGNDYFIKAKLLLKDVRNFATSSMGN